MTHAVDTRLLLAVADVFLAEMLRAILEEDGFKNIELRPDDDRAFFAKYCPGDYHLFIVQPSSSPLGMMSGLKLLSEVRKHDPRAKFLVLSGGPKASVQQSIKDLNLGNYTYLDAPCTRDQLLKAVDRALADHHESAA